MARAALGWSLKDLSERADVHLNTVRRCESGFEALAGTLQKLERVFRAEGVVFIDADEHLGPGVRLRMELTTGASGNAKQQIRERKPKGQRKSRT
jgi:ribosome-binding protein aMBF1 (putative translation factor)